MTRTTAALIFQEPLAALDPVSTVGRQIVETIRRHRRVGRGEAARRARELLDLVQVLSPERCLRADPHEISGGMRQRAMIASPWPAIRAPPRRRAHHRA